MKERLFLLKVGVALSALVFGSFAQATDLWDSASDNDDTALGTDNVLWHTAPAQVHDLQASGGVADNDWYIILPRAKRSYEVQLLNVTGDTNAGGLTMARTNSAGTAVLQNSADLGGFLKTIRWRQTADESQRIHVTNGSTTSSSSASYTMLFRETTLYCPRYNQSGTQVSVLIIQRSDANVLGDCTYTVYFFDEGGVEKATYAGTMNFLDDVDTIQVGSVSGTTGQRGGAHIAHTCGIGGFKAKMVALEPATGFSFDTPCTEKDR